MSDHKITMTELHGLFGDHMPIEAVTILQKDVTLEEARSALNELARGLRDHAPSAPEPVEYQRRWRECGDWTSWQRISKEFYDRLVEWPQDNELRMLYAAPTNFDEPACRGSSEASQHHSGDLEPGSSEANRIYVCYDGFGNHYVSRDPKQHTAICYDEDFADDIVAMCNREAPRSAATAAGPVVELSEDDPTVLSVAHSIAEHGFARPWDDFLPLNVHDTDQSDLIDYAKAAIAAMPSLPTREAVAQAIYEVSVRWIEPGLGMKMVQFKDLGERDMRLHLEYADAVLSITRQQRGDEVQ